MDGQVLKERLSKLTNLTQMELAEKLNVSQQSFSQYFLAKDVKSGLLERLAEIICCAFYNKKKPTFNL